MRALLVRLAALLLLPLGGCGGGGEGAGSGAGETTFTVLAASSLTEAFTALAGEFEAEHDGVEVDFRFESSTDLAESAAEGAPGDVLATADETAMSIAQDAGVTASAPAPFATNTVVLVTPPDNPAGVESLDDLEGATWVRCADDVPCGRVAVTLLRRLGVTAEPASLEPDVRSALEKVVAGEVDAGLVYASDAVAAGDDVRTIGIDGAEATPTTYFLAPLQQAQDAELAADWVDLVTSDAGRRALTDAGFSPP